MIALSRGPWRGNWLVSLRAYVTAAMLVALLPLLAHTVLATWFSYATTRSWAVRDLLGDVEHLARDVDARMAASRAVMHMVAQSPAAGRGDLDAVRGHLVLAESEGLIRGARVLDPDGGVLLAVGLVPRGARPAGAATATDKFLTGEVDGQPVLIAGWPVRSADPRLTTLEFTVSNAVLPAADMAGGAWPWHITAMFDRDGRIAWSGGVAAAGSALLRHAMDEMATAGVVHDWAAPDGDALSIAYARAPASGLTVLVGQPQPTLYNRVPFGPLAAGLIAVGAGLLSVALARMGAVQINAAYESAMAGRPSGPVQISDAMRLGAELRRRRDRLFQASAGIAVLELSKQPGQLWREAEVITSSANLNSLLGVPDGMVLEASTLVDQLAEEDRRALRDVLQDDHGEPRTFSRVVRIHRDRRAPTFLNMVGMMRKALPGEDMELVLTLQDVTLQRERELELSIHASRLQLAVDIAGLGVWERDAAHGVGPASQRAWDILGLEPRDSLTMETFLQTVHPDDRARVQNVVYARAVRDVAAGLAQGHRPEAVRYRILRPDGSVRHVRSSRVYVEDGSGEATARVVGVFFDETESVMAQRALAASEARLRLAVEVAELGVFERYIDAHRNVGIWNERMWRMRGLEPRPEPMTYDELIAMVHPDDRERLQSAMRSRRGMNDGTTDYEFRIIRPDGEERIIHSRSVRSYNAEDGAVSVVAINIDVTERRRAEQTLAESELRLRLAVDAAKLGIWDYDKRADRLVWSEQMWRVRGLPPAAKGPTRDEMLAMVVPEDRGALLRFWEQMDGEEEEIRYEYRVHWPDGSIRTMSGMGRLLRDAQGTVVRVVGVSADITEQRLAEQAMAESAARFRLAVETAQLGVAERDLTTGAGSWNEQMARICCMEPLGGRPADDAALALIHPDDRAMVAASWKDLAEGADGYATEYDFRIVRPDGTERTLHSRCVTLRSPNGAAKMLCVNQDVTEQRRSEQAIAESELRLRLATEATGVGIWDYDPASRRVVWSDRMWRLRGLEPQDVPLTIEAQLENVVPEDHAVLRRVWEWLIAGLAQFNYDYRITLPDGTVRHLHGEGRTLRDAAGKAVRCVGMVMDVTSQRTAELALRDKTTTLELALEAADLGVWVRDPNREDRDASARVWTMLGHPGREGQMSLPDLMATIHPDDREKVMGAWISPNGDASVRRREFRAVWPDGSIRYILSHRAALRDVTGHVIRIIGVMADITERREAELALQDRTTTLELALETADLGLWVRGAHQKDRDASPRVWAMLGQPGRSGPMTGEELMAAIHPDDRHIVDADWEPADAEPDARRLEVRVVGADGQTRHIQFSRAALRDADGQVRRVVGVTADVTAIRQATERLEASEARLRLAVEAAEMGVFDYDPVSREGAWSERTWRLRGLEPRPGLPTREETIASFHPDDRDKGAAMAALQFTAPDGTRIEDEFRVVWPDGTVRHLQLRAMIRRSATGTVRVFGVNMDVTERRTAALALAASEARLQLAVDTAGMGVFDYEPGRRNGHWSDRMWRIRGLAPRDSAFTYEEALTLVHPDDRARVRDRNIEQETESGGAASEIEFRVLWPDGSVHHLLSRAITQRDAAGTVVRIFGINLDVTDRRRAALALEENEARLRLASEAAELGVFQVNNPEGTGYWSDRMWRIRGWEPEPGLPDSDRAVMSVHPDDRDRVRGTRLAAATRAHGDVARQAFRIVRPDGAVRHISAHTIVLRGPEDNAFTLIGVNADVTEQVEREQMLREAAARFELAIDAAGLAVWDWDPATDRMTWSPRIWQIAGLPPRDPPIMPADRLRAVHPDDHAQVPAAWIRTVDGGIGGRGEGEFRIVRPDGSIRYAHWQGIPLRDAQGHVVRFAGVVADVTEARLAELALRNSEELFRMASEAAEQGVWNHDLATDSLSWSPRMWRIHGLPPADGAPAQEARIAFIHPEDRADVLTLRAELFAEPPNTVAHRTYRIIRADGAVRMLERQAMLVAGPDARPARIVGVVHDVTEARELTAQTMVADKLATLGEMAGAIAHELAQPLQAVMATAATARMRLAQGASEEVVERVSDRLAWIERQTARAGKTIQHLLSFSRGESSEGLSHLATALEGAMELAGHGLRRAGIEVTTTLPDDLPPVRGGQIEIEQVLVNLLNNARDAIGEREHRHIWITAREDGDSVMLDVADTGGGVPPDRLERIFEPFYTTKPVGRGTGIGLSLARRTMRAIGGGVSVVNTESGACFTLAFRAVTGEN